MIGLSMISKGIVYFYLFSLTLHIYTVVLYSLLPNSVSAANAEEDPFTFGNPLL